MEIDVRFVGACVLYKKILQDYSTLKTQERNELVAFLAQTVQQLALQGHRLLVSAGARMYAAVGLLQIVSGEDPKIVDEIMGQVAQQNTPQAAFLLLHLLNSLAEELTVLVIERRRHLSIVSILKSHRSKICSFWAPLLHNPPTPEFTQLILTGIASWATLKVQLLADPRLVQSLLVHYSRQETFEQVNGLFVQLLEQSAFAQCLQAKTITAAIADLRTQQSQMEAAKKENWARLDDYDEEALTGHSVEVLLEFFLTVVGPKFEQEMTQRRSIISKCFAEVFVQILQSFPVFLFLADSAVAKQIYRYAVMLIVHTDNSVSAFSLDIWLNLKSILNEQRQDLPQSLHGLFLEVFEEVFKRLLERSQISNNKEFSLLTQHTGVKKNYDVDVDLDEEEEDPEKDNKFKVTTLKEFRFKAHEVFYSYVKFTKSFRGLAASSATRLLAKVF